MRFLLGIVVGAFLTVCAAFIADHWGGQTVETTGTATSVAVHRPMVNWDVVREEARLMGHHAHAVWNRLSDKIAG